MATMTLTWTNAMTCIDGEQQEILCSRSDIWEKHIKRSVQLNMRVFLSTDYLILKASPTDMGNAHVVIVNSERAEVKNETTLISPDQDTTIYIGYLEGGTYDLTIELEDYTLYGNFEIE